MMLDTILQWIAAYLPFFIGVVAQVTFLVLPVNLRNWDDDSINVLTYIAMQLFAASILFIGVPKLLDMGVLNAKEIFFLLCTVFLLALVRALVIIPLEFTYPVLRSLSAVTKIQFTDFHHPNRLRILAMISTNDYRGDQRLINIRERLAKKTIYRS